MTLSSLLVISVARIGDTILLTPCLKAIKQQYPQARLTVLAHPKRLEVLENLPAIDRLGAISKHAARWRGWMPGRSFDAAVVYGRDAALVRYALRVAKRVICFDEPEFAALGGARLEKLPPPAMPLHAVDHRLMLLAPLGITAMEDYRLAMSFRAEEMAEADAFLRQNDLDNRQPLIGLQLFSFPAKAHRDWPEAHFAELIERLAQRYPQAKFVVLGDRSAAERSQALAARFPDALCVIAGQLSLRLSAAVMSKLHLYVGVDTGPTHIAGALGIPMVAMYHWQYPAANLRPLQNPNCVSIAHPATGGEVVAHADGMAAIPVQPVLEAALRLLEGGDGNACSPPKAGEGPC